MTRLSHFYDIDSADQLFCVLKRVAEGFSSVRGKRTQDLLLLVFGLTHLREWIAPDYDLRRLPQTREDAFYEEIFKLEEFNILRLLCNRSKHMSQTVGVMGTLYGRRLTIPQISTQSLTLIEVRRSPTLLMSETWRMLSTRS